MYISQAEALLHTRRFLIVVFVFYKMYNDVDDIKIND